MKLKIKHPQEVQKKRETPKPLAVKDIKHYAAKGKKQQASRCFYNAVFYDRDKNNGSYFGPDSDKTEVESISSANLIASRTTMQTHAPAIDIDIPAALVETPEGVDLWFDTKKKNRRATLKEKKQLKLLLQHLKNLDLLSSKQLPLQQMTASWKQVTSTAGHREFTEVVNALGKGTVLNLEQLFHIAEKADCLTKDTPIKMQRPIQISLNCKGWLIPSTSNQHLYLNTELEWEDYYKILRGLSALNIVESGYTGVSGWRKTSQLRLPWVKKETMNILSFFDNF